MKNGDFGDGLNPRFTEKIDHAHHQAQNFDGILGKAS
jgi:hypothetical protein